MRLELGSKPGDSIFMTGSRFRSLRVLGLGFQGFGSEALGFWGLVFLGFRVWDLGFRI